MIKMVAIKRTNLSPMDPRLSAIEKRARKPLPPKRCICAQAVDNKVDERT